jgi:hypothetical protein
MSRFRTLTIPLLCLWCRSLAALAVAALAVVCLGALTITSQRTELLVGSYGIKRSTLVGHPGAAPPHQPHGYGTEPVPCTACSRRARARRCRRYHQPATSAVC